MVYQTCDFLWEELQEECFPQLNKETWTRIASEYEKRWNFPNCCGALDGKHCNIAAPHKSGSSWFCYKKHFSMVLMAMPDAFCRFTWVNIGARGAGSDSLIFQNTPLGKKIINDDCDLPEDECPKGQETSDRFDTQLPYVFVGDEAFSLRRNLMHPYPGGQNEILPNKQWRFNYRLSRARRTVEGAYGILAARFRFLKWVVEIQPKSYRKLL